MNTPGYMPLYGDRFAPFSETIVFKNYSLAGSAFSMQVRKSFNDPGLVLADVFPVLVSVDVDSTISISIEESVIRTMAANAGLSVAEQAADQDLYFVWDLQIDNEVFLRGPFILRAGVTQ